jgi:hypothetical protein
MEVIGEIIAVLLILFLLPLLIVSGAVVGLYVALCLPFLLIGFVVYLWAKKKFNVDIKVPQRAKPATVKKERKPITIEMNGKQVPIGILIGSTLFGIVLTIVLIAAMILWFPWPVSLAIVCVGIGMGLSKLQQ